MTQHNICLALAKSEAEDIANSSCHDLHAAVTPSMIINMGMEHKHVQ